MTVEHILTEGQLTRKRREFINQQNAGLMFEPILFSPDNNYEAFRNENPHTFTNEVLKNLHELYKRFPTTVPFLDWLHANEFSLASEKRLAIPHGIGNDGKLLWDIVAAPPHVLQRKIQEASASELMSDLTKNIDTVQTLHENVDVVVIGASVGSNIAATLAIALGVEHFTLVDSDVQDGNGRSRINDPDPINDGRAKVFNLRDTIIKNSPYAVVHTYPVNLNEANIDRIFAGTMPENPDRKLIIIEEVDDLKAKDLIREKLRQLYNKNGNVVIISACDAGKSAVKIVIEEPEDLPYDGNNLVFDKNDPFASKSNPLAKILQTYGLITKKGNGNPVAKNIQMPPELPGALYRLMQGKIKSFEQSGLASRLAGVVVSQALISWLEGNLSTKNLYLDLSVHLDKRWQDKAFVKKAYKEIRTLQKKLGIKEPTVKKE